MAYLVKHPKSRFWFAVWRDVNGKQFRRSTKTTNRKTAELLSREFESTSLKQRTARQAREVIASLHREITGDELVFPTVREYVGQWLERKAAETSPGTLAFYRKSTTKFLVHIAEAADATIDRITRHHVESFRNAQALTLARQTANHDLKAIRMLFKGARREGLLFENPAEDVDSLKKQRGNSDQDEQRRPFTIPELRTLMDAADDEWRSMIQFGLFTGMRLADVASLTWANLDTLRGELKYQARKTGKTIILPIVGPLAEHIVTLDAGDTHHAPLHPRAFASLERTGKSGTLSNWFANVMADAGLRPRKSHHADTSEGQKGRNTSRQKNALSFHCLRHTAVSLLKDAGVPAAVVMELVGHDSTQMSEHYTHVGKEALAAAAKKMPTLLTR
jgi:integrase